MALSYVLENPILLYVLKNHSEIDEEPIFKNKKKIFLQRIVRHLTPA